MSCEEKIHELPKDTKSKLKNCKNINDVADEVVKNFNYFQLKIQSLEERLAKLEWKPKASKPADENDPTYKNKRNIYLGKLNDQLGTRSLSGRGVFVINGVSWMMFDVVVPIGFWLM